MDFAIYFALAGRVLYPGLKRVAAGEANILTADQYMTYSCSGDAAPVGNMDMCGTDKRCL